MIPVPSGDIDQWWDLIQPMMGSFYSRAYGRYLPEDIKERLDSGKAHLFVVMQGHLLKAVCMAQIITYPRLRDMRIFMMAGEEHENWVHYIEKLEDYARSLGCAKITGEARPGWEKILTPMGYKKTHVYLERDL